MEMEKYQLKSYVIVFVKDFRISILLTELRIAQLSNFLAYSPCEPIPKELRLV